MISLNQIAWQPPIFKFINRRYIEGLLTKGTIKIGTTEEYRIPDGIDDGRSDANESVNIWHPGASTVELDRNHPLVKGAFPNGVVPPGGPRKINLSFAKGAKVALHMNAFLYSGSLEYDLQLAERMLEKFDADACVKIEDTRAFIFALCKTPLLSGYQCHGGVVSYVDSNVTKDYMSNPLIKLEQFSWQKEFRWLWFGSNVPKTGVVIDVPAIVPLLQVQS
jgi:hypothetical protein